MNNIETFGKITDHQEEAQKLITQMKQDVTDVTEAVQAVKPEEKKKVYVEFSPGWTVGKGEFMDELITVAGGTNIAADKEGWYEINEENVIASNPTLFCTPMMLLMRIPKRWIRSSRHVAAGIKLPL